MLYKNMQKQYLILNHTIKILGIGTLFLLSLQLVSYANEKQWIFGNQKATFYQLINTSNNMAIAYKERDYGINLSWVKEGGSVGFVRCIPEERGPIKYNQNIAIQVIHKVEKIGGNSFRYHAGSYLIYKKRSFGINLGWSNNAEKSYEWKIRGGPSGVPVGVGMYFSLFNTRTNNYVVYGKRSHGINLVWMGGSSPDDPVPKINSFTTTLLNADRARLTWAIACNPSCDNCNIRIRHLHYSDSYSNLQPHGSIEVYRERNPSSTDGQYELFVQCGGNTIKGILDVQKATTGGQLTNMNYYYFKVENPQSRVRPCFVVKQMAVDPQKAMNAVKENCTNCKVTQITANDYENSKACR